MKYYKSQDNNLFYEPSDAIINKFKLTEISEEDFNKILEEKNKPTEADRIAEIKHLLAQSDFKVLPDYQSRAGKTDEEMQEIYSYRAEVYKELKKLEG